MEACVDAELPVAEDIGEDSLARCRGASKSGGALED